MRFTHYRVLSKNSLFLFLCGWLFFSCQDNNIDILKKTDGSAPAITKLSLNWGTPGTSFIIEGKNFDTAATKNSVKLGAATLSVTAAKQTELRITIPSDVVSYGTYSITVSVNGLMTTSDQTFTLAPIFGEGYTDKSSYSPGEVLTGYFSSPINSSSNRIGIYDVNHVLVYSVTAPIIHQDITTLYPSSAGFGFSPSFQMTIPTDFKSGVYLIENRYPFVVKSPVATDVVIVFPTNTENAYCESGGKSLYSHTDRPAQVSFLRPMPFPNPVPTLNVSEDGLQWLATQTDFAISYISDADLENDQSFKNAKLLMLIGHSEYWTRTARLNFDNFINNGGDALILSGNVMWWQVRYSSDGTKLICYKDQIADPEPNPLLKTINWNQSLLQYPITLSIGADYSNGGYGYKLDNGWDGYKIMTPSSPLLEGTGLKKGDIIKLPTLEYDGAVINSFDAQGYPILDKTYYNFYKMEIIGFDKGSNSNGETVGTFIASQRTSTSGRIVHTGSTNWCSYTGIGGADGNLIKLITKNAIKKLVNNENIFSY